MFLLPGIMDTHSHSGVGSWPSVRANADGSESTEPITPHVRAADAFNPARSGDCAGWSPRA